MGRYDHSLSLDAAIMASKNFHVAHDGLSERGTTRSLTIPTQPQESNQISTNVLTGDVPTAPIPVEELPGIITATPPQAPTQVTAPQVLYTTATSSSISSPSLLQF